MKQVVIAILWIVVGIFSAQQAVAQNDEGKELKVGLVLSGGGAKGLAHIGALKVIEEAGVRIDYIGGTSMGAIIGALYASGYSATQLDSIFRTVDFEVLIQDELPRKAKTFYEKNDSEKYAITLPFDSFKIAVPSALSKGQNTYNLLSQLTEHVGEIQDFSELPIPFFCMATNVEKGTQVLLEQGYLPRAITASGALPSLFSPVQIDGQLLIDGGVLNNYPVDEMRAKGVDIIIGVDVQDDLKSREDLSSAIDILVQLNNFRSIEAMKGKREKTDVYIDPVIEGFSVVSFDQGNEIIEAGINASRKQYAALLNIVNMQQRPMRTFKVPKKKNDSLLLDQVNISGLDKYSRSYILGKLKIKTPYSSTYTRFNQGVNNLMATRNFQSIDYSFSTRSDTAKTLNLRVIENPSRTLLRLGVHYDDLFRSAALINVTRKRLLTNNDVASLDLIVGDNLRYNFDYYIDKGYYWSIGARSNFYNFTQDVSKEVFLNDDFDQTNLNEIRIDFTEFTNQVYAQTVLGNSFNFGVGGEHKKIIQFSETIGIDPSTNRIYFEDSDYLGVFGFLTLDTRDNVFYPNSGLYFHGDFKLYLQGNGVVNDFNEFSIAKAAVQTSFSLGKHTITVGTEGGFKIGDKSTRSFDFFIGGYGFAQRGNIVPFYGYNALSLRGNTYLKADLNIDYEIFAKNHLFGQINIANVGDDLFSRQMWIDGIDFSGFAFGYGLDTFLGPIELVYSHSPDNGNNEWYVSLGYRF
ncbi:MAG: patatin-like phospholipase family protein [Gilvibacter sp.]